MSIAETSNREPPSKRKEESDGQDRKPKPHEMGLQVPRCLHTQRKTESAVPAAANAPWRGIQDVGAAKGEPYRRRAPDGRSRTHDDLDTAEIRGIERGGLHLRKKRDSLGTGVWRAQEKLHGAKFLGARLLCIERRPR